MPRNFLTALVFSVFASVTLTGQDNWRGQPQSTTPVNLWSVASDGDTLVAVGEAGVIIASDYGGSSWQSRDSGTSRWLVGVGQAGGRWVAVGDGGTILVSDDRGDSWTPRTSGVTARLNAVTYGAGRWLAVGEQGTVVSSPDGNSWTPGLALTSGFLRALAYGSGRFLVGGAAGALFTSTDGLSFTRVPIPTNLDIEGVAISPTQFFAVGSSGLLATATQLDAWTISPRLSDTKTFRAVGVRGTRAWAVGEYPGAYFDGRTWQTLYSAPGSFMTAVTLGRDEMVAVGFHGAVGTSSSLYALRALINGVNAYSVNALYGSTVTMQAVPFGAVENLAFQWYRAGNRIAGANSAELVLTGVRPADMGTYSAVASSGLTSQSTGNLTVNVLPGGRPAVIDPGFTPTLANSTSLSVTPLGDGKVLAVAKLPAHANDSQSIDVVRLNADGSIDPTFAPLQATHDFPPSIWILQPAPDGRIYVAGSFKTIGGVARTNLARLLPNGRVDADFIPDRSFSTQTARQLDVSPDGQVYVNAYTGTMRLTENGAIDPTFPLSTSDSIAGWDTRGRMLVRRFLGYGGPWFPQSVILRYLRSGAQDPDFANRSESYMTTFMVGDIMYGTATTGGGHLGTTYRFYRLTANGANDPAYRTPPGNAYGSGNWRYFYNLDGSLWLLESRPQEQSSLYDPRYYDAAGRLSADLYATLPNLAAYDHLAVDRAGSLYVRLNPAESQGRAASLARLRPLRGAPGRLVNLSVRARVASASSPLIAGVVTEGSGTTRVLIRGIGPALAEFGISDAMTNPTLSLTTGGTTVAANTQWPAGLAADIASVGAFALPVGSNDAAIAMTLGTGDYTAVVAPTAGSAGGTVLLELYELPAANPTRRFANLSARGPVAPGQPLILGFTISGDVPAKVLIRAIGATLATFGVQDAVPATRLTLYQGSTALYENEAWSLFNPLLPSSTAGTGAFALPAGTKDSAMLVTLSPGSYTATVESATGSAGTALVELYSVR